MEEVLVPIVVVPTIFFSIYLVIKTISDNVVRGKLVEKGLVDENARTLFQTKLAENPDSSLKYGIILIAIGVAILIGMYAPSYMQEEITFSSMFILGGLSLIFYYLVVSKKTKDQV